MNLLKMAIRRENPGRPPVWLMRQAGRYHSHYQELRKKYSFIDLCKKPDLACETTLGPIREFDFDGAILFSDLLFPLEAMGMGLKYEPGPVLDWHIQSHRDLKKLRSGAELVEELGFQGKALELIRQNLPEGKGLLGFVGGPLTLFCYAVEGSHQGDLALSKQGLREGWFSGFFHNLCDLLIENMVLQAKSGADAIAVLDTCAGEIDRETFRNWVVPALEVVIDGFKERCSETPLIYYSKGTGPAYWENLKGLDFQCLGVDWRHDIAEILAQWGDRWSIQGNIDPNWLLSLDAPTLEVELRKVFQSVLQLPPEKRQGWVCGLGHGVLPKTPEENVKLFVSIQREIFGRETEALSFSALNS